MKYYAKGVLIGERLEDKFGEHVFYFTQKYWNCVADMKWGVAEDNTKMTADEFHYLIEDDWKEVS